MVKIQHNYSIKYFVSGLYKAFFSIFTFIGFYLDETIVFINNGN